uniref:Uncharacterized protein n=1 Tax=Rhizophora mucronata TaxID=61149 RepID=A0A2P2P2B5_RHIMU
MPKVVQWAKCTIFNETGKVLLRFFIFYTTERKRKYTSAPDSKKLAPASRSGC